MITGAFRRGLRGIVGELSDMRLEMCANAAYFNVDWLSFIVVADI